MTTIGRARTGARAGDAIYVSGTIGEDIAVGAMKAGAHDYVMKGNLTRLIPAIQRDHDLQTGSTVVEWARGRDTPEHHEDTRTGWAKYLSVSLDHKDHNLAAVLLDLSQSATMRASDDVANQVLGALKNVGKAHKPQVERANFVVLRSPDVPSMLIETGFITNPAEEKRLAIALRAGRWAGRGCSPGGRPR